MGKIYLYEEPHRDTAIIIRETFGADGRQKIETLGFIPPYDNDFGYRLFIGTSLDGMHRCIGTFRTKEEAKRAGTLFFSATKRIVVSAKGKATFTDIADALNCAIH